MESPPDTESSNNQMRGRPPGSSHNDNPQPAREYTTLEGTMSSQMQKRGRPPGGSCNNTPQPTMDHTLETTILPVRKQTRKRKLQSLTSDNHRNFSSPDNTEKFGKNHSPPKKQEGSETDAGVTSAKKDDK